MRAGKPFAAIAVLTLCMAAVTSGAFSYAQSINPHASPKTKAIPPPEARVDINHASAEELAKVPGLTLSWAGRIVRFRPYRTKQDLLDHGILPSDVYDRIKEYIIAHRDEQ